MNLRRLSGSPERLVRGTLIGHYEILSLLGEGGMGEVYLARDRKLGRQVALKLLPEQFTKDAQRVLRFEQEAKAASALNHPNIITIHEVGVVDGCHFMATEFIDGETLRVSLYSKGRMETRAVLNIAAQVASALATAHEAGIIHRDIKPENIMLRKDGYVKVLDFGLAKLTDTLATQLVDTSAPTIPFAAHTETGVVLGTAQYMSPEQAAGKKVDARSDIFSFGAVLYELVTGQRAFQEASLMETVAAILNREPKPLPAEIPAELAKVIQRCLRKDPARRYQTMADLKVALEDLREEARTDRPTLKPLRWLWIGAALLSILLVVGLLVWQPWSAPESKVPLRAVPLTTQPGVHGYPSFSPDGNYVAFSWSGSKQDNRDIYVQQIGSGNPLQLTRDPGNDYNPIWSPDSRFIAFLRSQSEAGKSELRLIPPLGGTERKVDEIRVRGGIMVTPPYLAWCPESDCLVVTDSPGEGKSDALFVISLETGEKRQLTNPQPPASGDTNPAVSPDGSWLVFRRMVGLYNGELYRLPLGKGLIAAGEPQRLTPAELDAEYPTWMPNSREILFSAKGGLWRLVVPGENKPERLPFVGEDGLMPVVSRPLPGRPPRLIYLRSFADLNIWRVETSAPGAPASSPPVVAIFSTKEDDMVQLSPDGRRAAFTSTRSGGWEIWLSDPDGANPVQLTFMGARAAGYPHWSPDGERIVFHTNFDGQWEVYMVPAAGGKPRNLTAHQAADAMPSFSRDGRWIYFQSTRGGEFRIWKMPTSGGDAVQVTNNPGFAPSESPDGAYLYYLETLDKPSPLWRLPVSGGTAVKVLEGVVLTNYVVLDRGIYYIDLPAGQRGVHYSDKPSGETRLQYFDFATRQSITVARNLGNVDNPLTATADGRTILYARVDSSLDDLMLVEDFR